MAQAEGGNDCRGYHHLTFTSLAYRVQFRSLSSRWVVSFTTERSQPLLSLFICVFAAWIWRRNEILDEIRQGSPEAEHGLFWKIWPFYVKFICPIAILAVYFQ